MADWQIPGFQEVRELGRGSQGRVVLAVHTATGTPVAIKYLPADTLESARADALRQEARMLSWVDDPHVARLYRLVEDERGTAIVMEAVDGVPLRTILDRHAPLEPEAALHVLKGSLLGLAAAHAAGLVHRDYKPANVVVDGDGASKLIDFGIATPAGASSGAGTPSYMAPEQWRSEPASPATDVYAATCVFFECVTGRRPYLADDLVALRGRHLTAPVPVDDVPEALRPLLATGMAKDASDRPPGALAFVDELEDIARAAYGFDWEDRGLHALALTAAALSVLFPLTAAGLSVGAAPVIGASVTGAAAGGAGGAAAGAGGTAAGGAAAGGTSGAAGTTGVAGAGLLGAKVTAAVALTSVVAAVAVGTVVYAKPTTKPTSSPAPRPIALALSTTDLSDPDLHFSVHNAQFPQVSGISDPMLAAKVNKSLRGPMDHVVGNFRSVVAKLKGHTEECPVPGTTLKVTVAFGLSGPALASARYRFEVGRGCVESGTLLSPVIVDLRTGSSLRPTAVLRPEIVGTSAGLRRFSDRVNQYWRDRTSCDNAAGGINNGDVRFTRADLTPSPSYSSTDGGPRVGLMLAPHQLELTWGEETGMGCIAGPVKIPYTAAGDLLRPEILAAVTSPAPSTSHP